MMWCHRSLMAVFGECGIIFGAEEWRASTDLRLANRASRVPSSGGGCAQKVWVVALTVSNP